MHKLDFTIVITSCKVSHEEVLGHIQILDFCAFNGSHYFAIDAESHFIRDPLNFVVIEAIMLLNVWFFFPSCLHNAAAFSKERRITEWKIMDSAPLIPYLNFRRILFSHKVERCPGSQLFRWFNSGSEAAVLESLFTHDLSTGIWFCLGVGTNGEHDCYCKFLHSYILFYLIVL